MDRLFYVGVSAALFAAFAFSLNFVVPFIIGDYSTFDFALIRHVVSALVGLYILFSEKGVMRHLTLRNCLQAIWLAFVGYVGYFLTVTGAALFAGPVIAPAFLGLVPIVLMVIGNQRQASLPWRSLMVPLALVLVGLVLVNGTAFTAEGLDSVQSLWIGVPLALAAVGLWVWFALSNQAALAARPDMPSGVWSALILVGGGVLMLAFYPIGAAMDLFRLPILGFGWSAAGNLYVWGTTLALLATVGGVWAWNIASRSLPVALAAQLIVSETAFGVIGGLVVHARWPTPIEVAGVVVLIAGVVLSVRIFYNRQFASGKTVLANE
ncbi:MULTISPECIES: DMT family transporter [Rhizobium]|uniref:DMT family transporter n=1 Tax=Rhizobium anhuiense TaxID=1184720 RepID=A0A3S0RY40_9HYPH|nr:MULTISPECIES: DMT family transporter [Rhizobium]MBB3742674.1 drug/metabolite transporter (DMT)-like permease [Rhizobium sp. BK591]NKM55232.1 EamA/RhaT family transporter [Rhizobium anhuiense]RUM04042.1 DMT family transporter [Rhizobium anhuiense]UTS88650.1 DMT family transporter [Rhizobium anhuiense bv. trifolii]GGD72035.1 membrane protein [Rhizobium anhuiense]